MMSGTRALVFVVTLMSVIRHSYLLIRIELPSIVDKTFEEYKKRIFDATEKEIDKNLTVEQFQLILNGRLLSERQFDETLTNYNKYAEIISTTSSYQQIDIELSNFTDETRILTRVSSIPGCGDSLRATVEKYIQLRVEDKKKQQKKSSSITQPEETDIKNSSSTDPEQTKTSSSTEPKEAAEIDDEEIAYLKTLLPLTSSTGRIRSLLMNTLYGNSHNQTKATANSLRSVWFFLLKKLDPMFGESYISYVIRMINQKKMPLPMGLISGFYGNGKLQLFEDFDIWPELDAVFVMYFLFQCPFEPSKLSSSQDTPIKETVPIIEESDESTENRFGNLLLR